MIPWFWHCIDAVDRLYNSLWADSFAPWHEIKELANEASQWRSWQEKWKSVRTPLFSKYSASTLERTILIGANWQPANVGDYLTRNLGFVLDAFLELSIKLNSLVDLIHQRKNWKRSELTWRRKGVFSQSCQLFATTMTLWVRIIIVCNNLTQHEQFLYFIAAAAREPEANERGSSLISRRLHYRGLQSLFRTKRKELWLCANGRFRMRSGMRKE